MRLLSAVCIVLHTASHARTRIQCAHMIVMLAESSMPAACQHATQAADARRGYPASRSGFYTVIVHAVRVHARTMRV